MHQAIMNRLYDLAAIANEAKSTVLALPDNSAADLLVCRLAVVADSAVAELGRILADITSATSATSAPTAAEPSSRPGRRRGTPTIEHLKARGDS